MSEKRESRQATKKCGRKKIVKQVAGRLRQCTVYQEESEGDPDRARRAALKQQKDLELFGLAKRTNVVSVEARE
jgi:hypothetical protein